jgi:Mg2+/Co2+ transporter CorC
METNVRAQEVSVVDALLTIYRQQDEKVRRDFLVRVRQEDSLLDMPGMRTREEMIEVSRERMRDIVAGREQTLSHEEAMKLVDEAIAETV